MDHETVLDISSKAVLRWQGDSENTRVAAPPAAAKELARLRALNANAGSADAHHDDVSLNEIYGRRASATHVDALSPAESHPDPEDTREMGIQNGGTLLAEAQPHREIFAEMEARLRQEILEEMQIGMRLEAPPSYASDVARSEQG